MYTTVWHSCTHVHNLHQCYDQGPFRIISRDEIRISLIQIQTKSLEKDTFSNRYNPPILRHLLQSSTRRSCLAATSLSAVCSLTGYSSAHRRLIDPPPASLYYKHKYNYKIRHKYRNTKNQIQRPIQIDKYNELRFCALEADRFSSSLSAMPVY